MSEAEFEGLLNIQDGACAICKEPPRREGKSRRLAIDHDARSKLIRGLLCSKCNTALGGFRENKNNLEAAARYLSEPPAQQLQTSHRMIREQREGKLIATSADSPSRASKLLVAISEVDDHGEEYVTPSEAGSRIGVNDRTIRRWIASRKCRGICVSPGRYRVEKSWLQEKIEQPAKLAGSGEDV